MYRVMIPILITALGCVPVGGGGTEATDFAGQEQDSAGSQRQPRNGGGQTGTSAGADAQSDSTRPMSGGMIICEPVCVAGQECVSGVCEAVSESCDPACEDRQDCVDGVCQQTSTDGQCMPACARGQTCINGSCQLSETSPMACITNSHCPYGQVCNSTTRMCEPDRDHSACVDHEQCQNGYCDMDRCIEGCRMNSDCQMDAFCVDGVCRNDIECINDDDCPGEQTCISLTCTRVQRDCYDMDLDGFFGGAECGDEDRTDCDDNDPSIHPGVIENIEENCGDGIDNDCDGVDVPCRMNNDMDGDGVSIEQGDCDDTDPFVNPNQFEVAYDGKDNDCDPATPDCDVDGDGYGRLTPMGQVPVPCLDPNDMDEMLPLTDCDDPNPTIYPGAPDIPSNGIDEDCDGMDSLPG